MGSMDSYSKAAVERAMKVQEVISPQARGRSERNFATWQGRLPQELRLRGIATVGEAGPPGSCLTGARLCLLGCLDVVAAQRLSRVHSVRSA